MIEFRLPSLGSDMDEGKLLKWLVRPGDTVHKGQVIAVVDTSKAANDVECWSEGVVRALLVEPEAVIPVGTLMAVLRAPGERIEEVDAQVAAILAASRGASSAPAAAAASRAEAMARTAGPCCSTNGKEARIEFDSRSLPALGRLRFAFGRRGDRPVCHMAL